VRPGFRNATEHVWPTVVKQSSWRRLEISVLGISALGISALGRAVLACLGGLGLAIVVVAALLKYEPGFYGQLERLAATGSGTTVAARTPLHSLPLSARLVAGFGLAAW